jgi:hypothetical protein
MRIITASSPSASSYLFVLLSSMVYWLRVGAGAKRDCLPKALLADWNNAVPEGEAFCKQYRIPVRPYRAYTQWITSSPPDDGDELATLLLDHLNDLRLAFPNIKKNPELSDLELNTINRARMWHKSENEGTLEAIRASVGKLNLPPTLVSQFKADAQDIAPLVKELKRVVKKLTGVEGTHVPLEQQIAVREKNPEVWKEYLNVRKQISLVYKQELRNFVRDQGGVADIDQARKFLDQRSIPHRLPKGFNGQVNEDGALLTKDGHPLKTGTGGDVNNLDPAAKIVMNPNYDPEKDNVAGRTGNWVFKAVLPTKDAAGKNNEQYFYTGTKHLLNRAHKFDVVDKLIAKETRMVKAWRRDLASNDFDTKALAAQCELIYETCARVGGKDNANKQGLTFGLTTLLVSNVKRRGNQIILDYVGKDSAQQRHVLKPETTWMRQVIALIETLCEGKQRKDLLWEHDGSVYNANKLRVYFRQVSGVPDASPHKLRHLRGTRLARTELDAAAEVLVTKRGLNQKMVDTSFKDALTNVGRILGHVKGIGVAQTTVWTTAAKNYVAPSVMEEFYEKFKDAGIRPPAFLAKLKG